MLGFIPTNNFEYFQLNYKSVQFGKHTVIETRKGGIEVTYKIRK